MKTTNAILKAVWVYAVLTVASILFAVAFCLFFLPNDITIGGFTGIAQILRFFVHSAPIGIVTIILNIPLFAVAAKIQGVKIIVRSLYCMIACSAFIDILQALYTFSPMEQPILSAIFGGALLGVSSGMQIKLNATNGGTELCARLLKYKFKHISVGKLCMITDIVVITVYAIVYRQLNSALYGILTMYVFSIAVDFVVYGGRQAKMAYVISDKSDEIRIKLLSMDLGVTTVDSHGGWKGGEKQMILCVFHSRQIASIKAAVAAIDERAFVIVCDAHEVLGEGFQTYSPDDL